jgi:hypothetical protein
MLSSSSSFVISRATAAIGIGIRAVCERPVPGASNAIVRARSASLSCAGLHMSTFPPRPFTSSSG